MTPPPSDLDRCTNCNGWFTPATQDEVFFHATSECRRDLAGGFTERSPSRNVFSQSAERRVR